MNTELRTLTEPRDRLRCRRRFFGSTLVSPLGSARRISGTSTFAKASSDFFGIQTVSGATAEASNLGAGALSFSFATA